MPRVVAPVTDADNRFFWDGVRDGRLLIQRCSGCGAVRHPPGPMCPRCQSLDWEAIEASGRGTIHSWVLSHHPTEPDAEPRVVVLVDLEEGVRMVGNLTGTP
ncbi:MAG TPA: zinc ribbon domain-containing protein, partial [Acidimicrobiales bacterium]|nr:zinc ribbon domain-containing protein [Acidimicrobiales bacterium]